MCEPRQVAGFHFPRTRHISHRHLPLPRGLLPRALHHPVEHAVQWILVGGIELQRNAGVGVGVRDATGGLLLEVPIQADAAVAVAAFRHEPRLAEEVLANAALQQLRVRVVHLHQATVAEHPQQYVAADAFPPLPAAVGARVALVPDLLDCSLNARCAVGARCLALLIGEGRTR
eukprot:scaffold18828_cov103-Isochrysis_galbana.AAC.2